MRVQSRHTEYFAFCFVDYRKIKASVASRFKPIVITETGQLLQPTTKSLQSSRYFESIIPHSAAVLCHHPLLGILFVRKRWVMAMFNLIFWKVRLIYRVLKCIPRKALSAVGYWRKTKWIAKMGESSVEILDNQMLIFPPFFEILKVEFNTVSVQLNIIISFWKILLRSQLCHSASHICD